MCLSAGLIETSFVVDSADLASSKVQGRRAKRFDATLDKRTSRVCRDLDGKIIAIEKIKVGKNYPPMHPFC